MANYLTEFLSCLSRSNCLISTAHPHVLDPQRALEFTLAAPSVLRSVDRHHEHAEVHQLTSSVEKLRNPEAFPRKLLLQGKGLIKRSR